MKLLASVSVLALVLSSELFADDGSWSATYSLSEGSLYSETENRDIALEDEILTFDGFESGITRAAFFFSSTAAKDLTVQAGFPVRVRLDIDEDLVPGTKDQTGYFFSQSKYGPGGDEIAYARLAFADALQLTTYPGDEFMDRSPEYFFAKDVPPRKEVPAKGVPNLFDFSIVQDGAKVAYASVVIETVLVSPKDSGKYLDITFHFRHTLSFKAGAKSRVDIRYKSDYVSGANNMGMFMDTSYFYSYILGTGRTWKGPIGRLYLAVPFQADAALPRAFERLGKMGAKEVYLASGYEPAKDDEISMEYSTRGEISASYMEMIWFDEKREAALPKAPADDSVVVKGASSYLQETAAVYTPEGVISKAGFAPVSLFDGIPETAWCEGAKGDGIGEWVEFEIKQDMEALSMWNGYNRSFIKIQGKDIDTYYEKNNRPQNIEIVSADGKVKKALTLADTKELQSFDGVFLPKGTYKLYIRSVYKGTKWQDTCMGEIVFHPASSHYAEFSADEFLKAHAKDIAGMP